MHSVSAVVLHVFVRNPAADDVDVGFLAGLEDAKFSSSSSSSSPSWVMN